MIMVDRLNVSITRAIPADTLERGQMIRDFAPGTGIAALARRGYETIPGIQTDRSRASEIASSLERFCVRVGACIAGRAGCIAVAEEVSS